MKKDSRLSDVLHVLLHMAEHGEPVTSETLARIMTTNPVVVRRLLGGLRSAGFVSSAKGHGGGWVLSCRLDQVTMADIHAALGAPPFLTTGQRSEAPQCLVEQAVNAALGSAYQEAEALIAQRFGAVTLQALANDFHQRMRARGRAKEHLHEHPHQHPH